LTYGSGDYFASPNNDYRASVRGILNHSHFGGT
jgi:hypothetical protein